MSEWISVKDRLPRKDTVVLVIDESFIKSDKHDIKNGYARMRPHGLRLGYLLDDGVTMRSEGVNGQSFITHWMPLPEPPEGE